jgi:peptide/nickel transport system permease protein
MAAYIFRRLLWTVVLLLVITAVIFLIFYVLPSGDPAKLRAGRTPSPETIAAIRQQLGLDRSLPAQYWDYIKNLVLHFDFGTSYTNNQSVKALVFDRLPNTIFLVLGAATIWFISGVTIGIVSATRRGTLWDRVLMGGALIAISAPVYWLGLVSLYLFSDDIGVWHIFPGAGAYQDAHGFLAKAHTLILPWLVLAAAFAAIYARLLRSNLLETMSEDYIRTARAKGLSKVRVIALHAFRNALIPVITVIGLQVGVLFTGAILTETIFSWPGVGKWLIEAINRRDYPVLQGGMLLLGVVVMVVNLLVDVTYGIINPRIRQGGH